MKRLFFFSLLLIISQYMMATSYAYSLSWESPHTHTYEVQLETEPQTSSYTEFKIPAWRPGRYRIQNYAASISNFSAKDSKGQELGWRKLDKDTWRVKHGPLDKITISYHYYANNSDAGSSYLTRTQAYFNPVNLFMYVPGRLNDAVSLELPDLNRSWGAATALTNDGKFNRYTAESYHEFVDSPTVFSPQMKEQSFTDQGTKFYLHFQGDFEGGKDVEKAAMEDIKKICQYQASIFGGYPFKEFHFIYRFLPYDIRHGVEHSNSVSIAVPARLSKSERSIKSMNSLTAHELWHAWNVKRIRPEGLWPYDYSTPQYTTLHWFTEGVTDYYALMTLIRTGLMNEESLFRRMSSNLSALDNDYAAQVVSPSDASFNSWLETSEYFDPFRKVSVYAQGERLGLLMDLGIRKATKGEASLDDVFRYLFATYYERGRGVPEDGIKRAMEKVSGVSWEDFFEQYVDNPGSIDFEPFLSPFGLELEVETDEKSGGRRLGILRMEDVSQGLFVSNLHPGGDAYRDGLGVGDLILTIDDQKAAGLDFETYFDNLKKGATVNMTVFSGFEVKEMKIRFQGDYTPEVHALQRKKKVKPKEGKLLEAWLKGK